ncbi:energy transducer TonB [Hymenobacter aerilatus]|uniref:Energy transducer TonB n=1 Tax=Hymenobacter aerilatus TaxID=2932251 RepID=A0A8T9T1G5_9BACT|nr:energy transducer TonB [Hymenobacter aerilatus]UOR06823.1 energy transducer TonB [Hymenobacter aerilatus]
MTTNNVYSPKTRTQRWLPVGALVLLAQAGYAQMSFNRWEGGTSSPTDTPARRPAKRAAATADAPSTAASTATPEAARRTSPAVAAYSKPLRRGLGQRVRTSAYSAPDAEFYRYAWQHLRYPATALQAGLSGQVLVRLNVNSAGDVIDSEVLSTDIQQNSNGKQAAASAGKAAMRQSAEDLLWGLRFEPATGTTQEDVPVRYVIQ